MQHELMDALAKYVHVLAKSAAQTSRAEDKPLYTKHLAEAAILFSLIHQNEAWQQVQDRISGERRGFGWGYLSGPERKAAETAFDEFAKRVDEASIP